MEINLIIKKIGARIYLELNPIISDYGVAQKLSQKVVIFLEKNKDPESLGVFLYSELKEKIYDLQKSRLLAKIIISDYTTYNKNN